MFYDFSLDAPNGGKISMLDFKGKVVLVVNTATACGFTPQYKELEELYEKYKDKGFEIIDVPCNQFGGQAPGSDEEISQFCELNFSTSFIRAKKTDVKGESAEPLFKYLISEKGFEGFGKSAKGLFMAGHMLTIDRDYKNKPDIKWNFTKFLVDREGNVVERFEPTADHKKLEEKVASLL